MLLLNKFIHAVHLQRPYHQICRWCRKRIGLPPTPPPPAETPKEKHAKAALAVLENFLFSNATLDFTNEQSPLVSIVIVLYNRAELTFACLRSLLGCSVPCEIIVIDNYSTDLTQPLFEKIYGVSYVRNNENLHFLLASNQGAKLAIGKHLLLLNNDTEILPGAIECAIERLEQNPEIGAVGGRLILPDGRLQEAGCFVWNEGICEGYGRGARPDDGAYLFSRPVDYCSAAFLLTPLDLWRQLGGFDTSYAPAYYEDADYCLRVWEAGRSVYYEPRATIQHYEYGSATPESSPSLLMQQNKNKFNTRHKDRLANRPCKGSIPSVFMRSPPETTKNRLLFCDEKLPHIKTGAGFPRANKLIHALIGLGYDVSLYPISLTNREKQVFKIYEDIPPEVEILISTAYGLGNLCKVLNERAGFYSTLIISRPTTMQKIQTVLKGFPNAFKNIRLIYDAEALFALREIREKQLAGIVLSEEEINEQIAQEVSLSQDCDTVLTVSQEETEHYKKQGISSFVVGHSIPEKISTVPWDKRKDILFIGAIPADKGPNFITVMWFLQNIWPQLSKRHPQARFIIAGTNQSPRLTKDPLPDRVVVTGALDSLDAVYDTARVFVAPTHAAAGIPLKIIEVAAHGIPVVCSSLLARQLRWQDGKELSVADEAQLFIDKCETLYTNQHLWTTQRDAALATVRKEYSAETFKAQLRAALNHTA